MLLRKTNSLNNEPLARRKTRGFLEAALKSANAHSGLFGKVFD
jgi:hypothetical protein